MNLIEAIEEILMDVFEVDNGFVGSNDSTVIFDADKQTH
jgi:hypothetical protein